MQNILMLIDLREAFLRLDTLQLKMMLDPKIAEALFDSTVTTYSTSPELTISYDIHLGLLLQQRQDPLCLDHYLSAATTPENLDYKYALGYAYGEFGRGAYSNLRGDDQSR